MRLKSIFKILILFLLGMALGAFIMGWFVNRRLHKIHEHQAGKGFSESIIHYTAVEGKEKEELLDLASSYGEILDTLRRNHHDDKIELLNQFESKAVEFLSSPSKELLLEHLGRLKRGPKHPGKPEGKKKRD